MKKVLLVDDYKDWLVIEKGFIERFNDAECITFDNPLEALIYLRRGNKADILITDYQMPEMSGVELSISVNAEFPNIRIIISSGYDKEFIKSACYEYAINEKVEIICKDDINFLKKLI